MGIDILASSDPGADDLSTITIDAAYARRLEHNKNREALHRLKELQSQGRASDSSDSDSSSSPSPPASPSAERDFIRKLILVKRKDPILTHPDLRLFHPASPSAAAAAAPKKSKPLYLKDVNARHLLESGPELDDDDDKPPLKNSTRIYKPDQADSIREFLQAEKAVLESGDGDDFMKEKETETADADEEPDLEHEFDNFFGKDDELDDGERFLKGYLKDRKWIDREKKVTIDVDVSEDEDALEKQEKYEASYNFRYEEPEQAERVLGHARVVEGSVRKKPSSRKTQRKSKEERMAQAEFERKAELKHLKNLKKKEIQEKLEKVRAIAGIGEGGDCKLGAEDLEEDFDPEEYDKKMREMFGDDYYEENDADPGFGSDDEGDMEKPDFGKEDELLGLPEGWDGSGAKDGFAAARERFLKQKAEQEHEEEPEKEEGKKKKQKISLKEKYELEKEFEEYYKLNYDDTIEDLDTRFAAARERFLKQKGEEEHEEEPEKEEGKKKKKKKQKISLKEKVELEKEFEEYYKLDYEDTIEDLKTRFKYKPVKPNTFGLHSGEILMADEKNLNQYVSLKKLAPYREQEWEVTYHQKKRKPEILQIDPGKISKKHRRTTGESSEAEKKPANHGNVVLSERSKRRHRQKELKPSLSRLVAFGKVEPKPHKKR